MKGWELSKRYFEEALLPLIRKQYPAMEREMAVGVLGMGSDAAGLDDELSREHHWGPRCNFVLLDSWQDRCLEIEAYLIEKAPPGHLGFAVYNNKSNRSGITVETVSDFFRDMLKHAEPPSNLEDWLAMTESDLFQVTRSHVFYDGPGEFARRRQGFSYYPDPIWRKKIGDWCVFLVGHGVYNINRSRLRQHWMTATIWFGVTVKRVLEMGHLLNRTYSPYNKWLQRSFQSLPVFSDKAYPLLEHAVTAASWEEKCLDLIRIKKAINDELHRQGLAQIYYPSSDEPKITEEWFYFLYDAAVDLYRSIPKPLVYKRFNDVEKWEVVAKQVLMDPNWKAGFHFSEEEAEPSLSMSKARPLRA